MMRTTRFFYCDAAKASAAAATGGAEAVAATTTKKSGSSYKLSQWREVKIRPWMQQQQHYNQLNNNNKSSRSSVYFHGEQCGPQPVLLLPSLSFSPNIIASASAKDATTTSSYATFCSALNYRHGVINVPYQSSSEPQNEDIINRIVAAANKKKEAARTLRGDSTLSNIIQSTQLELDSKNDDGFLTEYCHDVVRKLDQLNVEWVTCVAESFGAFAAAKLALLFPERIGSIFLLNTPLVSPSTIAYNKHLHDCRKAVQDINVPKQMYEFTVFQELLGGGEVEEQDKQGAGLAKMLPSANKNSCEDVAAVRALFGRKTVVTNNSSDSSMMEEDDMDERMKYILADADVNAWMTHDQLSLLRHPMCLALPADKSAQEIETAAASATSAHEQFFNIKRIAKLKSAPANVKSLMEPVVEAPSSSSETKNKEQGAAVDSAKIIEDTADALNQWIKRYDADELVKRRWQQAKTDMDRMLTGSGSDGKKSEGGEGDSSSAEGGKKGKKGKKKDKKK